MMAAAGLILAFAALASAARDPWAATAVYLAVLALAAFTLGRAAGKKEALAADLALPAALLAAALGVSFFFSVNPGESFYGLMDWLAALLLFLTALQLFRSEASVDVLLAIMAPVIWLELLIGLWQRAHVNWISAVVPGTLVNASPAAAFLIAWIPAYFDRFRRASAPQERVRRWLWGATLAACALAILNTLSVWAAVCLLAAAPWLKGPRRSLDWVRRHPREARLAAAAAAAAAGALVWWKFAHKFDLDGHPIHPSAHGLRLVWWGVALRMLRAHPWTGVGIGNFPSAHLAYEAASRQHTLFAHSFPLQLLSEAGLLGGSAALAFFAAGARSASRERWPFSLGAWMLLSYCAINPGLEFLAVLLLLLLFLAIAAAPAARQSWKPSRAAAALAAGAALAAAPFILAPWQAGRLCVSAAERLRAGDRASAARLFADAVSLDARSSEAEFGLAWSLLNSGKLDEAAAHLRRACALNRLNAGMAAELAACVARQGRREEALSLVDRAAALEPGNPVFQREMAELRARIAAGGPGAAGPKDRLAPRP